MIALIGFMGSGKTTLAKALGESMKLPVYEIDQLVFKIAHANSMTTIFERGGEMYLRELEQQALSELSEMDDGIIDCGGGLVTFEPSLELLQKLSKQIILLKVPFELAQSRVGDDATRPLFQDESEAKQLYESRIKLYESVATDVVDVHGQSVDELITEIKGLLS